MADVRKRLWWSAGAVLLLGLGAALALRLHENSAAPSPRPRSVTAVAAVALEPAHTVELVGQVVDDDGAPIAGAQLQARSDQTPNAPAASARSDPSGGFRFAALAPGTYAVEARAEHHELAVLPDVRAPAGEPARIVLQRTSTLRGLVIDTAGKPVSGATVTVAGSGIWPPRSVSSDAAGAFAMTPVASGIYELRATLGHFTSGPQEGVLLRPASESVVNLRLLPGASLRGRVFDAENGKALLGAAITVTEDALSSVPITAKTDADGQFDVEGLRLLPHRLWVRVPGYAELAGELRTPGADVQAIGLRRAGSLSGVVVDEQARPIAGAEIEVTGKTDTGDPLRVSPPLAAAAAGALARPVAIDAQPPSAGDNLGVTHGAVPKVPLFAATAGQPGASDVSPGFRTDAAGHFHIEGVPPGEVVLIASRNGYALTRAAPRTLRAGERLADLKLVLARGSDVHGRVLDARGFPLAWVRVQVEVEGERTARVTLSADDGTFLFEALRGRCMVTALPVGQPPVRQELVLRAGETREVELRMLGAGIELSGRVLDARGFPIASAMLRIEGKSAKSPVVRNATSQADGTFVVTGLPPPPYHVQANHPDYATTHLAGVSPKSGKPLAIELRPGARLSGKVVDTLSGAALVGARVTLRGSVSQQTATTRADTLGDFDFRNLTIDKYDIIVAHDRHVTARLSATLTASTAVQLPPFKLLPAGGVSGSVVDRLGAPVWNAEVAVGAPPVWAYAARTDHAGHFHLDDVAPGDTSLAARHTQAGESERPVPVRVYAQQESPGVVLRLPGSRE